MVSFLSVKLCAAIAAIHSAKSRPERALSSAKNCCSSWRSSAAIASGQVLPHVLHGELLGTGQLRDRQSLNGIGAACHSAIHAARRWRSSPTRPIELLGRQAPGAERRGANALALACNFDVVDLGPALGEGAVEGRERIAGLAGGVNVK